MNGVNSLAFGQKLAMRLVRFQCFTSLLVGTVLIFFGYRYALAGLLSGLVIALSTYFMANKLLSQLGTSSAVLGRFITGVMLKWVWIASMLAVLVAWAKLPPLGIVIGVVCATSAQFFVWIKRDSGER